MLTEEEQMDYDSFPLASPSVTRAPLRKFAEDRLSMDFPESEASFIAKRAHSELLDWVGTFCSLER